MVYIGNSRSMKNRYKKSQLLLKEALDLIPLGSQTFGKCHLQFPESNSPHFIEKGLGAYVWDVDGNRYIDFMSALLTVNLGYQDKEVDNAVKRQMKKGVVFSFAHPLEIELSKKIIEMVPCAEMVRFGKNGSDVTTAAIRLARNYTGREHVIVFGYHGWHDWYIDTTSMCLGGVPKSTKKLVHSIK
jgi:glutamate-1-semialdehyde 2,1-aminomutase